MVRAQMTDVGRHGPPGAFGGAVGHCCSDGSGAGFVPSLKRFRRGGPMTAPEAHPPAEWYLSPDGGPGKMRCWDGTVWPEQYRWPGSMRQSLQGRAKPAQD